MNLPNRRQHIIQKVGDFAVCVGFVDGLPVEVFFTERHKPGSQLEQIFYDLGVTASKIMQGE